MTQKIMHLNAQIPAVPNTARRTVLEHSVAAINTSLNRAVSELYQIESQKAGEAV